MNTTIESLPLSLQQHPHWFTLDHLGVIACSGDDATPFLQGQLTCDVNEVTPNTPKLGAYCNHKGRIKAIFWLFRLKGSYLFVLPKSILDNTLATLNKYAVFSKIELSNVSNEFHLYGVSGPQSTTPLAQLSDVSLTCQLPGPINRYLLITETSIAEQSLTFEQADMTLWQLADILAELPTIYPATQEKFTPHMVNLPKLGGVSFTKGCYLGQEIIARTEYRGKNKRSLKQVIIDQAALPAPGATIGAGHEITGTVLQTAPLNAHQALALIISLNAVESE